MNSNVCVVCNKNRTEIKCHSCQDATCKKCSYFVDETCFEYISLLPETLAHKVFCQNCYNNGIDVEVEKFHELLRQAKQVDIYDKNKSTETRLIRRTEKPIQVTDCADENETLLRLAFLAVQKGFQTLVDVEIKYEKVGDKSYKKFIWHGNAVPVDPSIRK